ncbi:MAG: GNAT family N-acetyltransferase [Myxococcota bacterium]|nr:GNAT family N-acetyltransferase [Myxococcota bacterium]
MFERQPPIAARPRAAFLTADVRDVVLAYLHRDARLNLQLLDLLDPNVESGGVEPVVLVAWEGNEVVGVAALRPSLLFDAQLSTPALEAFLPFLESIDSGLLKSLDRVVDRLWALLEETGRRSLIDRFETAFAIEPGQLAPASMPAGATLRHAVESDLPELVYAARASLREEHRPDPGERDLVGFERWVRRRLARARVVETRGRLAFVGYADVRHHDGWLVQGVFTWPEMRRRGFAAAAMTGLVDEAFATGTDHVQLAVIEGNAPGLGLYRRLGFRSFARLRTVLFAGRASRHR